MTCSGSWEVRFLLVAALVAASVTGCGVPTQTSATPLPSGALAETGEPAAAPSESVSEGTKLWFVSDGRLVPMQGGDGDSTAQELLDELAVGPPATTDDSVRSLLADPVAGGTLLAVTGLTPERTRPSGVVTVGVTDSFASLPADEQVLLLGQVVLTLTSAGAEAVLVTDTHGAPLAIPLPDGRLLDRAATASDYAPLILQSP